jgi:hypothetical protein
MDKQHKELISQSDAFLATLREEHHKLKTSPLVKPFARPVGLMLQLLALFDARLKKLEGVSDGES